MCVYARAKEEKKSVSERQEVAPVITTMKNNNVMHSLSLSLSPLFPLSHAHIPCPTYFFALQGGASSVDLWRGISREYFRRRGDDDAPSRLSPFSLSLSLARSHSITVSKTSKRERDHLIQNPATALGCEILSTLIRKFAARFSIKSYVGKKICVKRVHARQRREDTSSATLCV